MTAYFCHTLLIGAVTKVVQLQGERSPSLHPLEEWLASERACGTRDIVRRIESTIVPFLLQETQVLLGNISCSQRKQEVAPLLLYE